MHSSIRTLLQFLHHMCILNKLLVASQSWTIYNLSLTHIPKISLLFMCSFICFYLQNYHSLHQKQSSTICQSETHLFGNWSLMFLYCRYYEHFSSDTFLSLFHSFFSIVNKHPLWCSYALWLVLYIDIFSMTTFLKEKWCHHVHLVICEYISKQQELR